MSGLVSATGARGDTTLSAVTKSEYHDGDLPLGSSLVIGIARIHRCQFWPQNCSRLRRDSLRLHPEPTIIHLN